MVRCSPVRTACLQHFCHRSDDERRCYKAFKSACYHTNDSLSKPAQSKVNATLSGTTACFAVVADGTISVGSVGTW